MITNNEKLLQVGSLTTCGVNTAKSHPLFSCIIQTAQWVHLLASREVITREPCFQQGKCSCRRTCRVRLWCLFLNQSFRFHVMWETFDSVTVYCDRDTAGTCCSLNLVYELQSAETCYCKINFSLKDDNVSFSNSGLVLPVFFIVSVSNNNLMTPQ